MDRNLTSGDDHGALHPASMQPRRARLGQSATVTSP